MSLAENKPLYGILILAAVLIAAVLRLPELGRRPMHTDEAVHAIKFGTLLEEGVYRYDNSEYHGPTLNYFTLIPAWARSAQSLRDIDESTLRLVPVVFGIGTLLLLVWLAPGLGRGAIVCAGLLTAVSPAMVFYSRYYIQETLLVCFASAAIVCGYRYSRAPTNRWALATGLALGLMHATKETSALAFAAMAVALGLTVITGDERPSLLLDRTRARTVRHGLIGLAGAGIVSALFYSSFFTHPAGIVDSYTALAHYLDRAQHDWHVHPWHYYLQMLIFFRVGSGPVWSEASIVVLAGVAILRVFRGPRHRGTGLDGVDGNGVGTDLARFLSFYSIVLFALYSAIPYKTPWNLLSPLHGLILLAGVGAASMLDGPRRGRALVVAALLLLAAGHLGVQACLANWKYYADPVNPYVYAHPTDDVVRIAERVQALANVHPSGNEMYIEVIVPGNDYWPLPWYLRAFPNTGWWDRVEMDAQAAPVILATPSVEADLLEKLYERPPPGQRFLYLPFFESPTLLRPTIELRGWVVGELADSYHRQTRSEGERTDD